MAGVGGREKGGREAGGQSERQEERATCGVPPSHILPSTLIKSKDEQVLQRKGNETPSVGFAQPLPSCLTPLWQDPHPRHLRQHAPWKAPTMRQADTLQGLGSGVEGVSCPCCRGRGFPRMWHSQGSGQGCPWQTVTFVGVDRPVESTVKGIRTVWPVGSGQ